MALLALILSACGGKADPTSETAETKEVPGQDQDIAENETDFDIRGLYTNGSHDRFWAV